MQNKFIAQFILFSVIAGVLCVAVHPALAADTSLGGGSGITNPLSGGPDQTITSVLTGIIKWMLGLVGFLALIALIIGGGRMVIDFGNEEQVHKGKTTVMWAVIGLAVVILSYALLNIVVNEVLGGGAGGSSNSSYDSGTGTLPNQMPVN